VPVPRDSELGVPGAGGARPPPGGPPEGPRAENRSSQTISQKWRPARTPLLENNGFGSFLGPGARLLGVWVAWDSGACLWRISAASGHRKKIKKIPCPPPLGAVGAWDGRKGPLSPVVELVATTWSLDLCSRACPRRQNGCQASVLWEGLGRSWFVTTCFLGPWDVRLS